MNMSGVYGIRGVFLFDTLAAADFKWRRAGPASPKAVHIHRRWILPGATAIAGVAVDTAFSAADLTLTGTGLSGGYITLEGIVHVGSSSGLFSFQWAQNTATVGDTAVMAGSWLAYTSG